MYCCGGGATLGYQLAGFEVTGVDIEYQSRYRGSEFIQSDAIEYLENNYSLFDAIHASPPCQFYSLTRRGVSKNKSYADLIGLTRRAILKTGLPYIMENVVGAPLISPILLCGAMFDLRTYRHRLFESNFNLIAPNHPEHKFKTAKMGRPIKENEFIHYVGHFNNPQMVREMTGLHWLNRYELSQSIPPVYTEYLGKQLMRYVSTKESVS